MRPCVRCSVSAVCYAQAHIPGPKAFAQGYLWPREQRELTVNYDDGTHTTVQVDATFARFLSMRPKNCPRLFDAPLCELPVLRPVSGSRRS